MLLYLTIARNCKKLRPIRARIESARSVPRIDIFMNAVEIETAVSTLASQPFDAAESPFPFLAGFGNKETTIRRLRAKGETNASDLPGGVFQRATISTSSSTKGYGHFNEDQLNPAQKEQLCARCLGWVYRTDLLTAKSGNSG